MIVTIKIKVKLKIKMINKNENENENENVNDNLSSILWRHFNQLKHKQKHLSNIQQDIKKKKKLKTVLNTQVTFIQTICKTFI